VLDRQRFAPAELAQKGAYVLWDSARSIQVLLIGTGSEVALCVSAAEQLVRHNIGVRVVSMPSWELFERQPQSYRESVLLPDVHARVAVEAGVRQGWDRYIGTQGAFVGMQSFGASAPFEHLFEHFQITTGAILSAVEQQLAAAD
jgi:transketolase